MRVHTSFDQRELLLGLALDPEDGLLGVGQVGMSVELVTDRALIRTPSPVEPHPDLVALAVLSTVRPWCDQRLTLDFGVSPTFASGVYRLFGVEMTRVDEELRPRAPGGRLGLLYSGGPDCMAAAVLVDEKMPLLHLKRIRHPRVPNRATHLRVDVHEALVRQAGERGEELHIVETDLEYLCKPYPTFPSWSAITVGVILQADELDLGGVVTGRNLNEFYTNWGRGFSPDMTGHEAVRVLFSMVGLDLVDPIAGGSDVANMRIAPDFPHFDLARSCQLGTPEGPCFRCGKCLSKNLVTAALHGRRLPDGLLAGVAGNAVLVEHFTSPPPYDTQPVLGYTLARVPGLDGSFLHETKEHLRPTREATAWVGRYYRPAIAAHVPERWQRVVAAAIEERVGFMTPDEEAILETWDGSSP